MGGAGSAFRDADAGPSRGREVQVATRRCHQGAKRASALGLEIFRLETAAKKRGAPAESNAVPRDDRELVLLGGRCGSPDRDGSVLKSLLNLADACIERLDGLD